MKGLQLLALSLLASAAPAFGQLDRAREAHGSLAKWRSFSGVEFDVAFKSPKENSLEHQLFNLQTRAGLITSDKYSLGTSGSEVWVRPGLGALGATPPRFYMWTPFIFSGCRSSSPIRGRDWSR